MKNNYQPIEVISVAAIVAAAVTISIICLSLSFTHFAFSDKDIDFGMDITTKKLRLALKMGQVNAPMPGGSAELDPLLVESAKNP